MAGAEDGEAETSIPEGQNGEGCGGGHGQVNRGTLSKP